MTTELIAQVRELLNRVIPGAINMGWISDAEASALRQVPTAMEAQQAGERVPLTDEQLRAMHHKDEFGLFCEFDEFEQIARAVEQAHRITSTSGKEGGND